MNKETTMKAKRLSAIWLACALALPLAAEAAQTCRSESEVPSTTPTGRFTDHGDGTVTDTLTGLMWAQCAAGLSGAGCAVGSSGGSSWQGALDLAAAVRSPDTPTGVCPT
ncbi:MAG: hypothetical protein IPG06_16850 [Haliea sp.]|nr:hypothetical protein [Haliea sp.]